MDLGLSGKVALITGSSRGTGEVIARRLAREGATVIVHSMGQGDAIPIAESIKGAVSVWGDITLDEGAEQVARQCSVLGVTPDILINNYGTAAPGRWDKSRAADWIRLYEQNAISVVRMVQLFSPGMQAGSRIINLGTIGSTQPAARMPHYYAAKGALATMTVSLANELSGRGITVNLVSPGLIRTPEVEASLADEARRNKLPDDWPSIENRIVADRFPNPMGRIATREEVADLVVFLASDKAGFINAQNIRVDGGAIGIV